MSDFYLIYKKYFILRKIFISFSCKFISKDVLTLHFNELLISIIIEKQPSSSVKPVNHIGLILLVSFCGLSKQLEVLEFKNLDKLKIVLLIFKFKILLFLGQLFCLIFFT